MKKKTTRAYFNALWEQMATCLGDFLKDSDQEKLHQFRLYVKKLKALLVLIDDASAKTRLSREFKPVKKVFRHCGVIREAYINLQLSANYGVKNEEFILRQVNAMEEGIKEFGKNSKKYLKTIKAVHNKLEANIGTIDDESISQFYKKQLEQIAQALATVYFDERLHNCRKQLKTLIYNRKIASEALNGKLSINNGYLDKLQGHIGDWHDNMLAMELFSAPEVVDKTVIARIKKGHTKLKKTISIEARDFFKKAVLTSDVVNNGQAANVWV